MNITIKTVQSGPFTKDIYINDGKNTLSITEEKWDRETRTALRSNGDSIYTVMDLLKIWEATR